ncbi:signal recognition particle-docking protein FtsY [Halostella sp. JP-L12]|uniref:signal recognition particle-docking protein FtsY n=1 Tax=Halostella TaxID=1843185 RepID=UPI000EF7C6F5|nr:signal recognition particle-docking protein FtsY [Halostella sp. JP-L12]
MFDSLKDKLGSFRDEAEEVAEEKAEELDEEELEELEDEAAAEETAAVDDTDATDAEPADGDASDPEATAEAAAAEDVDVDPDAAAAVDEGEAVAAEAESPETAAAAEAVAREDPDAPTSEDADESGVDTADEDADEVRAAADEADAAAEGAESDADESADAAEEESSGGGFLSRANPFSSGSSADDAADESAEDDAVDEAAADADVAEADAETGPAEPEAAADSVEAEPVDGGAAEPEAAAEADEPDEDADDAADEEIEDDEGDTGFAAKAKAVATGKFVIEEEDLEDPLWELEMALLESDVEMSVAKEILSNIEDQLVGQTRRFTESTGAVVEEALGEAILDVISVGQFDFDERVAEADKPLVIIFTGVNGVGKTTSIAKLSKYLEDRGFSSVMANGDTYRAGANEQIREHAENLDRKLITHEQGGDPAAVIYDAVEYAEANDVDVVLGDTAGRLHTNEDLMDQLAKIERVVGPDMTLFVDEAVAGQDAVNRAKQFNEAAEIDGTVLTKADADSQGGAAISIAHVTGKPILFLGVGQGYDDIEPFDPEELVDSLLGDEE